MQGNGRIRSSRQILTAVGMVSALLFGAAAPAVAQDVVIRPIESNLASKPWVSVTASSGAATATEQLMGISTPPGSRPSGLRGSGYQLNLGGAYDNIRKVEVVFPDRGRVPVRDRGVL